MPILDLFFYTDKKSLNSALAKKKAVHHEFVRPSHLLILELILYFLMSLSTLMDSMMYRSLEILFRKSSFRPTLEESILM